MSSISTSPTKSNTRERNRALLCKALAAGACVLHSSDYGAVSHVPSKSDPATIYQVSSTTNAAGARVEHCTCPAMQGSGADSYTRSIVTWRAPDGTLRTNGVLPCSHILVDRFTRYWSEHSEEDRRGLVEHTDELAAALATNTHYPIGDTYNE
jgi:hypothetical protein